MSSEGFRPSFFDPDVRRHLLTSEGEVVEDEVRKHWVVKVWPVMRILAGVVVLLQMPRFTEPLLIVPLLAVGLLLCVEGLYRIHAFDMDRLVITNTRVFRVHGVFSRHVATMPLARILDIAVDQPFLGTIFNYGHFVFESAAQDQGLRDIRYVPNPHGRDLTLQRVIQRSGIRAMARNPVTDTQDDGT